MVNFIINLSIVRFITKYDMWTIGGYAILTMQLAMFLCVLFRVPYVIMFDGINP